MAAKIPRLTSGCVGDDDSDDVVVVHALGVWSGKARPRARLQRRSVTTMTRIWPRKSSLSLSLSLSSPPPTIRYRNRQYASDDSSGFADLYSSLSVRPRTEARLGGEPSPGFVVIRPLDLRPLTSIQKTILPTKARKSSDGRGLPGPRVESRPDFNLLADPNDDPTKPGHDPIIVRPRRRVADRERRSGHRHHHHHRAIESPVRRAGGGEEMGFDVGIHDGIPGNMHHSPRISCLPSRLKNRCFSTLAFSRTLRR